MTNGFNMQIANAKRVLVALISLIQGEKVKVNWGRGASCNEYGEVSLPNPKTGSAAEIALMTRQVVHELGHRDESDYSALDGINLGVKNLLNAFEDPRIEAKQVAKYPGAALMLNRGLEGALEKVVQKFQESKLTPELASEAVQISTLVRGYMRVAPHEAIQKVGPAVLEQTDRIVGGRVTGLIDAAIDALPNCNNTHDVRALSEELHLGILEKPKQAPEPDEPSKDGDSQDSASDNDQQPPETEAESSDQSQGEEEVEASGQSEATQEPQANSQDESQENGDGADQDGQTTEPETETDGQPESDAQPQGQGGSSAEGDATESGGQGEPDFDIDGGPSTDLGTLLQQAYEQEFGAPDVASPEMEIDVSDEALQAMQKVLQEADEGVELDALVLQMVEASDDADIQAARAFVAGEPLDEDDSTKRVLGMLGSGGESASPPKSQSLQGDIRLSGVVSRLVRIYLAKLQDKRRRPMKMAAAGGQVAANRLWRLQTMGDSKLFRARKPVAGIDAAMTILLDKSDSMEEIIVQASKVCLATAQALERISKVRTSIETFPSSDYPSAAVDTLQKFGQSARQVASKCEEVRTDGTTPMTEALRDVVPKLLMQRCERRFLLLVTDGEPDDFEGAVLEATKALSAGIEILAIGMGEYCNLERLQKLAPYVAYVDDVSELPGAMEQMFKDRLSQSLVA